jgi:hypothetical protein
MTSTSSNTVTTSEAAESKQEWEQGEIDRVEGMNRFIEKEKERIKEIATTMAGCFYVDNERGLLCRVLAVADEQSSPPWSSESKLTGKQFVVYAYVNAPGNVLAQDLATFLDKTFDRKQDRFTQRTKEGREHL